MTETWTLPMTADEIGEMYRTAKSKAKEVGILAELNATSKERIVAILTEAGFQVDGRATRYLKKGESDTSSVSLAADTFPSRGRLESGEAADTHTHRGRRGRSRSRWGGCGRSWRDCLWNARCAWGRIRCRDTVTRRLSTC